MSESIDSRKTVPASIENISITSNNGGNNTNLATGIVNLCYYESILHDNVSAAVVYADTGNSINGKGVLEGLPLVGTEKVGLKFTDNNNITIEFDDNKNNPLYVNKVTPISDDTRKSMVRLDLTSKEFILNDKIRVFERFDGKISDSVSKLLKDSNYLGTKKNIDIEDTSNNFNFIGNNKKPMYLINWLSKKSISSENQKKGDSAGYFYFETSEGYKFKSIDGLLGQEKKKSIIFNETKDIPAGYDVKALEYSQNNMINAKEKMKIGAFSTRTILFDPFSCYYEVMTINSTEKEKSLKLAGKSLPKLNPEFNRTGNNKEFSRTSYYLLDKGTIPSGNTQQQIEKSRNENFEYKNIANQANMRYNQFFSAQTTVTIPGDFSLHAGDAVFLDVPELDSNNPKNSDEVNKETGGIYIITDLCHYITPKETYTKLNLMRDSFGRTGNHTSKIN
jgi:hypothetical protein